MDDLKDCMDSEMVSEKAADFTSSMIVDALSPASKDPPPEGEAEKPAVIVATDR